VWGYTYSNVTTAPPNSQQVRFNNLDLTQATEIYIDNTNLDGINISNYLGLAEIDDDVYVQDKNEAALYQFYKLIAVPSQQGTYTVYFVQWDRGGSSLNNNQASVISLLRKGNVGPAGPQGVPGIVGPAGPAGEQGVQGVPGDQGIQGVPGLEGPRGETGLTGAQGVPGDPGPKGDKGDKGDTGDIGPAGPTGSTGATGAAGPTGSTGATGATGPAGSTGAVGPPGPTAVSANANNYSTLGTDNLLYTPTPNIPAPSSTTPAMDGTPAVGAMATYARADHVHPSDTSRLTQVGADARYVQLTGGNPTGVINLKGRTDNAAAGVVGEVVSQVQGTNVPLTTNVAANVITLPLAAGDWDVGGTVQIVPSGASTVQGCGINTVPAAMPAATSGMPSTVLRLSFTNGAAQIFQTGRARISLAAPGNVYLVAIATFGSGTVQATGFISARRC